MLTDESTKALFPSFEQELINEIRQNAILKRLREGDVLMRTGQYFRSVIVVVSGLVKVFREDDEGSEYFMHYLQQGQACALSMVCASCHETSNLRAVTVTDTEVMAVPLEYMDKWMKTYKSWHYFVLESYKTLFLELLSTVDHVVFRNMDERLLFYLKKKQETLSSTTVVANHTIIAQELNSSREVISRLMKKLAENGRVQILKGQQIKMLNPGLTKHSANISVLQPTMAEQYS